jgi:hypothetical protein
VRIAGYKLKRVPKPIRRVAVLRAGTMGSRIAAHLANAQIPSLLLDVDIRPDIVAFVSDFCDRHLGKGVVPPKTRPFFLPFNGKCVHSVSLGFGVHPIDLRSSAFVRG